MTAKAPYAQQPWRTLYLTYQVLATLLLRIPLWTLYFLPPFNRPKPTWSVKRSLALRLTKHFMYVSSRVGGALGVSPDHRAIYGGPNVNGVWIAPAPQLVVGEVKEWVEAAQLECVHIPGYWIERGGNNGISVTPPVPKEKVLLFLHGGGYVSLSGHPKDTTSSIPRGIMKHTPSVTRTLSLEYRLTKPSPARIENPFPAALIDAIAGYNYLVKEVGFDPSNVVVVGDSAGGHLALSLVRYLVENKGVSGVDLPAPPAAVVLSSPWTNLSLLGHAKEGSVYTNQATDIINAASADILRMIRNFLGPLGDDAAENNRYISPASEFSELEKDSFQGFPKTFIVGGGSEVFRDQIRVLYRKMSLELGQDVVYLEQLNGIHDTIVFPWMEPERTEALQAIALWLEAM